jgi:carboxyl-terminal processing protease
VNRTISRLATALVVFLFLLSSFASAQQRPQTQSPLGTSSAGKPVSGNIGSSRRITRGSPSPALPLIERDFEEALKVIEDSYITGGKLDYNSIFKSSVLGMLRSLDPHSNYYDREEFEELKTDQRSEYFGIGASIQNYATGSDTDTFITSTFDGSPAEHAALRFGDRILEVDSINMTGKASLEVRDKIRGPRGSVVRLKLERAGDKRIQTVALTRDAVPQPSIPDAYMVRPGVGYVDMTRGFNYTTTDELQDALARLHAKGMQALVLDLRNNPGGFLDQAIHVAEVFLSNGQPILTQKGRNGFRDNSYESRNSSPDLTPLVILINGNTASASEIVAGAMQDHDRAIIVGTTSFGKGLVQSIIPLEYGAGLTLTSAKYYTPSGRLIQRDYSSGGFYDYYTHGGSIQLDKPDEPSKPSGEEKKTDTGRAVYGGGGIAPDETVKPRTISPMQRRLLNPVFTFSRELVNGRISGFESFKIQGPVDLEHELKSTDFPITPAVYSALKEFVAKDPNFSSLAASLDHNRSFIELQLRYNIVTAAYGRVSADRVFVTSDDPQLTRALEALPRARNMASSARQQRLQP